MNDSRKDTVTDGSRRSSWTPARGTRLPPPEPDEPRRHRWYMVLLAVLALGTVPFAFVGGTPVFVLGLPLWLWSSLAFTVALAVATAWGLLRLWRDDNLD